MLATAARRRRPRDPVQGLTRVTVALLTSNQPRHVALANALSARYGRDQLFVVQEPKSFYPGGDSLILRQYWSRVRSAERDVFGQVAALDAPSFTIAMGELSALSMDELMPVLRADRILVFGSSFIQGWLMDALADRGALNLHVGIAPEYRGSAPNAWALRDGRLDLIGAQVQRLAKRLDGGTILAETRVAVDAHRDPFIRGMLAARRGIDLLLGLLEIREPWLTIRSNDPAKQIAYHRSADFTEKVAAEILGGAGDQPTGKGENMTVRAKFKCTELTLTEYGHRAKFLLVTSRSPGNEQLYKYTLDGALELGTIKEMPFEVCKQYYLDITAAE